MGVFDDIIKGVAPEDRAVLDKYPALKTSMEKLESDFGQVSRFAGDWINWQKQNWDESAGMTKAERALREELEDAQARLTAAAAAGSGASAATVDALKRDFDAKLKEVEAKSLNAIEGMNLFYQATAKRMLPHQQEFKETLDPQALMKFMTENRINDPDLAYDRMVAGKRQELAAQAAKDLEAKHAADIEAARKEERDKVAQERAMGPGGALPTDQTGGIAGVTAQMNKPADFSDAVKTKVSEAKLGDGSLAQLGYEMYRRGELPVQ